MILPIRINNIDFIFSVKMIELYINFYSKKDNFNSLYIMLNPYLFLCKNTFLKVLVKIFTYVFAFATCKSFAHFIYNNKSLYLVVTFSKRYLKTFYWPQRGSRNQGLFTFYHILSKRYTTTACIHSLNIYT